MDELSGLLYVTLGALLDKAVDPGHARAIWDYAGLKMTETAISVGIDLSEEVWDWEAWQRENTQE